MIRVAISGAGGKLAPTLWKRAFHCENAQSSEHGTTMTTRNMLADRCKLPRAFRHAIERLGLQPAAVLRHTSLATSLHLNNTAFISTPQLFAG